MLCSGRQCSSASRNPARTPTFGGREHRVDGAVRRSVIADLGRADDFIASARSRLAVRFRGRLADQVFLVARSTRTPTDRCRLRRRIGEVAFGRVWDRLGIAAVLDDLLKHRATEFAVERAVFVATLHGFFRVGSRLLVLDEGLRYCRLRGSRPPSFLSGYGVARRGIGGEAGGGSGARCVGVIEEKLFDHRRDLFTDLSVFVDPTSLSFYGEGGGRSVSIAARRTSTRSSGSSSVSWSTIGSPVSAGCGRAIRPT